MFHAFIKNQNVQVREETIGLDISRPLKQDNGWTNIEALQPVRIRAALPK